MPRDCEEQGEESKVYLSSSHIVWSNPMKLTLIIPENTPPRVTLAFPLIIPFHCLAAQSKPTAPAPQGETPVEE
jgi:hypothetical protein